MAHHPINFSPFATNVLDVIGNDRLYTPSGIKCTIKHSSYGFIIDIGDRHYETQDNLRASYILNSNEVGLLSCST